MQLCGRVLMCDGTVVGPHLQLACFSVSPAVFPFVPFSSPHISSLPHLIQAPSAKTSVTRRQAAATIPGGVPSGKLERVGPASKTSDQSPFPNQSPPPPPQSVNPTEVTPGATAATGGSATQVKGKGASGTPKIAAAGKATAASKGTVGPSAVSTKAAVAAGKTEGSATAVGGAAGAKAGGAAVAAVEEKTALSAKEREEVTATDKPTEDRKKGLKAGPETTAAEKVWRAAVSSLCVRCLVALLTVLRACGVRKLKRARKPRSTLA